MICNQFVFIALGELLLYLASSVSCKCWRNCRSGNATWCYSKYGKPDGQWGGLCKWGKCQSPIVLSKCRSTEFYFGPLLFYNYDTPLGYLLVSNNGHGVSIDIPEILKISISGGPLASEYALVNIHWHWDRTEHIIAGQSLILEMHLVHRNMKYCNMAQAMKFSDGIAVLAVLHRHSAKSSFYLKKFLPKNFNSYFTYEGSLTTPPCAESVTWIVFTNFLEASRKDIEKFKNARLADGSVLERNFRSVQPINNRPIWFNKPCLRY
ncbi:carbonic anhydrase 6-like [Hermetia illucens]|uniref:carbonic anhydrase 6-like n=1 Tax=Hermetia illucens TaxID=343691 RepID=UPI0018CC23E1|nr:carbonic anhydrase 6-like [Hermetia illucens]